MKKKRDDSVSLSLKVTRIMKITLILILVGVIQVSATTYAQEHRISVSVKNGTFYDVVSQIERQSEFMFFYKSEEIDGTQRINLTYIIHSGFISGYQNRYGDNLKPPTNVYHRMTA